MYRRPSAAVTQPLPKALRNWVTAWVRTSSPGSVSGQARASRSVRVSTSPCAWTSRRSTAIAFGVTRRLPRASGMWISRVAKSTVPAPMRRRSGAWSSKEELDRDIRGPDELGAHNSDR